MRMILFDRGGIVDEYASVPEFYGPLPPGEVIAMHANPVVVERYTGASQASVRATAPVASAPADLPPAGELLAGLAAALGLSGSRARVGRRARRRRGTPDRPLMLTLVDAPRCPYCARVRIALAEKGIDHEAVVIDLADRPAWVYELNPVGQGAGHRGGRVGAARVRRDQRVPRGALPGAGAPPGRSRRRGRRRACGSSATTTSPSPYYDLRRSEDGAEARVRRRARRPRRDARRTPFLTGAAFGLADIALVPWVIRARDMLGVSLEPYPHVDGWLGASRRAPVDRGRDRDRRSAVSDIAPRGARAAPRRGRPRRCSTFAHRASSRARPGTRATCRQGHLPGARNVDLQLLIEAADADGDQGTRRRSPRAPR